jgi:hypothetical protein
MALGQYLLSTEPQFKPLTIGMSNLNGDLTLKRARV